MSNLSQATLGLPQRVFTFAHGKLGKQVGTGECYDLADRALRNAGAKSASDYGPISDDADYVWGKQVDLNAAEQGDVLQFRDHVIRVTVNTTTRKTHPDGRWEESTKEDWKEHHRGHHTAIISSVNGDGTLTVFEQHVKPPGKKHISLHVQKNTIYVRGKTTGPKKKTEMIGGIKVETETTTVVEVSGTIWVYRPENK